MVGVTGFENLDYSSPPPRHSRHAERLAMFNARRFVAWSVKRSASSGLVKYATARLAPQILTITARCTFSSRRSERKAGRLLHLRSTASRLSGCPCLVHHFTLASWQAHRPTGSLFLRPVSAASRRASKAFTVAPPNRCAAGERRQARSERSGIRAHRFPAPLRRSRRRQAWPLSVLAKPRRNSAR
jgi:hypothetical protein